MLIIIKVKEDQISKEVVSFLKKHENNGVEIIKLMNDEDINIIDKLVSEIVKLIYKNTMDYSYNCDNRDMDRVTLSEKYKFTELQALKKILEFLDKMEIKCTFKVTDNFYINVSWCKQNSKEDINKLQDIVNEVCEKYEVRNDLVILK